LLGDNIDPADRPRDPVKLCPRLVEEDGGPELLETVSCCCSSLLGDTTDPDDRPRVPVKLCPRLVEGGTGPEFRNHSASGSCW